MPDLLLLRHAKSDWSDSSLRDVERPLNARGREAARAMGHHLARLPPIDAIWASPAIRVRQTLEGIRAVHEGLPDEEVMAFIYGASSERIVSALRDARADRLLLVGHNPTMHDLTIRLTRGQSGAMRDTVMAKYPTGALAVLNIEGDWSDLRDGAATLAGFTRPADL